MPPGELRDLRDFDRPTTRPPNPGLLLVISGLIVLSAAGGVVLGADRQTGDSASTAGEAAEARSPEQTAIAYLEALGGGDCPTAIDLLSARSWQAGGQFATVEEATQGCTSGALLAATPALDVDRVDIVSQQGDTVVVAVTGMVDGQPQTVQLTLVQDAGVWKVQLGEGGAAPGGVPPDGGPTTTTPAGPGTTTGSPDPGGSGGGDPGATTPPDPGSGVDPLAAEPVVRSFYDAMVAEDCPTLIGMTTPDFWTSLMTGADPADLPGVCADAFTQGFLTNDLGVQDIHLDSHEGATATFSVALVLGATATPATDYLDVVLIDDQWKVNYLY